MIVDASALISILVGEPDAATMVTSVRAARSRISVANWFEASLVAARYRPSGAELLDELIGRSGIEIVPVTVEHGRLAREAHRRFGRGSGSPARLNFGDCFAYALAVSTGEPLLFKGDDFTHTDVTPALG